MHPAMSGRWRDGDSGRAQWTTVDRDLRTGGYAINIH